MAREFAKSFYNSKEWINSRNGYIQSKNYICERCGGIATICHHKEHLTPNNIDDLEVTLKWDCLQAVCLDCHNRIHGNGDTTREGLMFDNNGNLIQAPSISKK